VILAGQALTIKRLKTGSRDEAHAMVPSSVVHVEDRRCKFKMYIWFIWFGIRHIKFLSIGSHRPMSITKITFSAMTIVIYGRG
jgi:hypothetical protein